MAGDIGGTSFDIWKGNIQVPAQGMQKLDRLGRNFTRTRSVGLKSKDSIVTTSKFAANNAAALVLAETTYPDLQGTIKSVTDSLGNIFENVAVLSVGILTFKDVIEGGSNKVLVQAEWTLMAGLQS